MAAENIEEPTVEAAEQERYSFDRIGSLMFCLLCMGGICFGLLVAWFMEHSLDNPSPQYFSATETGQLLKEGPLDQPTIAQNVLFNWVTEAMLTISSFNFMNFQQVIQKSAEYFTPEGYESYKAVFQDSKIQEYVINNKLILIGTPTGAPQITKEGVFADRYLWKMTMPILFQYRNVHTSSNEQVTATLLIMRVPTSESANGILIRKIDIESKGRMSTPNT